MKASELTGAALDWAVTKCEGFDHEVTSSEWGMWGWATDWAQGGPIIEREGLQLRKRNDHHFPKPFWQAGQWSDITLTPGPTPLIAAMRCYVASKLGADVDVPKELP
jgi:hypothetical protein